MEWTRRPWMRLLALAAGVALIVMEAGERGAFFWLGIVIVVLNVIGLVALVVAGASTRAESEAFVGEVDTTLADLARLPEVERALAAAPPEWRQVSCFDHAFESTDLAWLSDYVWITTEDGGWGLGIGDEVKPYLDLDLGEAEDPAVAVLAADPRVASAYHEDRELYRVETRTALTAGEFSVLAIQALNAHHLHAVERLDR